MSTCRHMGSKLLLMFSDVTARNGGMLLTQQTQTYTTHTDILQHTVVYWGKTAIKKVKKSNDLCT